MMARKNTVKLRINIFDACEQAAKMLLEAGFELRYQSQHSETRYFGWPGRPHTLRVSAHRGGNGPIGLTEHVAKITFFDKACEIPNHIRCSNEHIENAVCSAIGRYMIKSARPLVSRYKGKKGTWEDGRGDRNRTCDNSAPDRGLYQPELHPEE